MFQIICYHICNQYVTIGVGMISFCNQYVTITDVDMISVSETMKIIGVLLNTLITGVFGHGYLAEPPARNAMWR